MSEPRITVTPDGHGVYVEGNGSDGTATTALREGAADEVVTGGGAFWAAQAVSAVARTSGALHARLMRGLPAASPAPAWPTAHSTPRARSGWTTTKIGRAHV